MDEDLLTALREVGLEERADVFVEEELSFKLLSDMGDHLAENLLELGLSGPESVRLAAAVLQQGVKPAAAPPSPPELQAFPSWASAAAGNQLCVACDHPSTESSAPSAPAVALSSSNGGSGSSGGGGTAASAFAARVAELQAEFFAEDLHPPTEAAAWDDETLVGFFESGGDLPTAAASSSSQGASTPGPWSVAPTWAVSAAESRRKMSEAEQATERDRQLGHTLVAPAHASYAGSSSSSLLRQSSAPRHAPEPPSPDSPPAPPKPLGAVVGSLPLKYQKYEVDFDYAEGTTVSELKAWLESVTTVPASRQRLIGWAPKDKKAAEREETRLHSLALGPRTSRLLLMGTPLVAHAMAEDDLERGKRTSRFIANDLRGPPPPPKTFGEPDSPPKRTAPQAIHATRGGGIYLDPHVWARTEAEDRAERRARGHDRHVRNPATNRMEPLHLGNALVAQADGAQGGAIADFEEGRDARHVMEGPVNVDLMGTVRGRCRGCTRCEGYERQERDAENPNDVEVLNCRRCGCGSHEHEAL